MRNFASVILALIAGTGWQWTNLMQTRGYLDKAEQIALAAALTVIFFIQQIYLVLPKPARKSIVVGRKRVIERYLANLMADYHKIVPGISGGTSVPAIRINVMLPTLRARGLLGSFLKIYYSHCWPGLEYSAQEMTSKWKKGEGLCGFVWKENEVHAFDKSQKGAPGNPNILTKEQESDLPPLGSILSAPIRYDHGVLGVLNVDSNAVITETQFRDERIKDMVLQYADHIGEVCFAEGVKNG